jgi:outer membrane lipoprotein LolB
MTPGILLRQVALTGFVALVAGCASTAVVTKPSPDHVYTGRFAVTAITGERQATTSGRFSLETFPAGLTLELATPLGSTLARIEVRAGEARLQSTAEGGGVRELKGKDIDALTGQMFGWTLPVSGLADWIEGHPATGRPVQFGDSGNAGIPSATTGVGAANVFIQDGWRVEVRERTGVGEARRVDLSRAAVQGQPALQLRLAVEPGGLGEFAR